MSKIFFILLIIGGVFLASGYSLLFYFTSNFEEKYPDLVIFLDAELEQAQLSSTPIDLLEKDELTITLVSPADNIFFSLIGPDGTKLYETIFSQTLSFPFVANSTGTYTINVGNMYLQTTSVDGFITEKPVIIDEFILNIGSGTIASSILILIGVILVILSFVILAVKIINNYLR